MGTKRANKNHRCITVLCLCFLMTLVLPVGLLLADQGHEAKKNGIDQKHQGAKTFSIAGFGEQFELTITYPRFKAGEPVPLTMYLADLATNKPVSDADITLNLTGPDLEEKLTPVFTGSPGEYFIETRIDSDNVKYSFFVELTAGDDMDIFDVTGFSVPEPLPIVVANPSKEPEQSFWKENLLFIALGGMVIAGCIGFWLGSRGRKPYLS